MNVGAHVGLESMVYSRIAGPTGRLFIFEPFSVPYRMLEKNVYINGLRNRTTLYKVAASNKKGKGEILVNYDNIGGSRVQSDGSVKSYPYEYKEDIDIDLVDNVMPEDVKVDFALIDV